LRFALEPGEAIDVEHERLRQHLERHFTIQPRVARAIHLSHAAGPDGFFNLVIAEAGTR